MHLVSFEDMCTALETPQMWTFFGELLSNYSRSSHFYIWLLILDPLFFLLRLPNFHIFTPVLCTSLTFTLRSDRIPHQQPGFSLLCSVYESVERFRQLLLLTQRKTKHHKDKEGMSSLFYSIKARSVAQFPIQTEKKYISRQCILFSQKLSTLRNKMLKEM